MKFKRGTKLNKINLLMLNEILVYVPLYKPMLQFGCCESKCLPMPHALDQVVNCT